MATGHLRDITGHVDIASIVGAPNVAGKSTILNHKTIVNYVKFEGVLIPCSWSLWDLGSPPYIFGPQTRGALPTFC